MEMNETENVTTPETETLDETVSGTVAETETVPEKEVVEIILVDVERPFMQTSFEEYSVSEGFLLLIFVLVLLNFFLNLVRR